MWIQRDLTLDPHPRGIHLVTGAVLDALPELGTISVGLLHVFIAHTSASLTVTENASPDVRRDLEGWLDAAASEATRWEHSLEGADDMPAHVKASLMGASLTLPVRGGALALGTWQGVCLCEHRDRGGRRRLTLTLHGEG